MEHQMTTLSVLKSRRAQDYPGYAFAEIVSELIAAGWQFLARQAAEALREHRSKRARLELHGLSDRFLRDIGLERGQIDRLFR